MAAATLIRPTSSDLALPAFPLKVRNRIEMLIAAEHGEPVLKRECCDPRIIRRDRSAGSLETEAECRVGARSLVRDVKNLEIRQMGGQPPLVLGAMPGLRDTVAEFTQHDDGKRRSGVMAQDISHGGFPVDER